MRVCFTCRTSRRLDNILLRLNNALNFGEWFFLQKHLPDKFFGSRTIKQSINWSFVSVGLHLHHSNSFNSKIIHQMKINKLRTTKNEKRTSFSECKQKVLFFLKIKKFCIFCVTLYQLTAVTHPTIQFKKFVANPQRKHKSQQ